MTNPYPPAPPRRLTRSRHDRMLGGVCGGVAAYLNMDVTLVRVLTVLITLFTGVPVIAYLVALFVMPEESASPPRNYPPVTQQPPPPPYGAPDPVWGPAGAPWEQPVPPPQRDPLPGASTEPGDSREPR